LLRVRPEAADQQELCGAFGHTFLAGGFERRSEWPSSDTRERAGQPSPPWARAPTVGQDGVRRYCGGQHAVIGVWPVLAHRGARSDPANAGAGDGCQEPWTRGDERTFGTPCEPARRASNEWRGWRAGWPFLRNRRVRPGAVKDHGVIILAFPPYSSGRRSVPPLLRRCSPSAAIFPRWMKRYWKPGCPARRHVCAVSLVSPELSNKSGAH